jgi:predicted subunit of tRNA(5-methylaminomethyl-2-thiouridylate) methyltransferase
MGENTFFYSFIEIFIVTISFCVVSEYVTLKEAAALLIFTLQILDETVLLQSCM